MSNQTVTGAPRANMTLLSLQAGRGIAALAVLFHHACNGVLRQGGELPAWLVTVSGYGYLGVDFFFVLSGFIIYYVNQPRRDDPDFARKYLSARLIRVYVPYLPLGIMVALAYVFLPQLASGENTWNWFTTLTLLPSTGFPALAPAWTLQHEVLFYALALLAFLTRSFVKLSIAVIVAALAVRLYYPMSYKAFGLVDIEFIFGILAAWCFMNHRATWNALLVVAGLAVCTIFFIVDDRMLSVIFGLGLALLLLPVIRAERAGQVRIGPTLTLMGDASYAIYLIHYPLVSALARLLARVDGILAYIVIVIVSIVAGVVYHKLFEQHALVIARRWIDRKMRARPAAIAPADRAPPEVANESDEADRDATRLTDR